MFSPAPPEQPIPTESLQQERQSECLGTPESVVIDGANSICGASRRGRTPSLAEWGISVAFLIGIAALVHFRRGRKATIQRLAMGLLGVASLGACSGYWALTFERADAPGRRAGLAAAVARILGPVEAFARARSHCVATRNECVECEPILRFVTPRRQACPRELGKIDLGRDAMSSGCTVHGDDLDCGRLAD